MRGSQPQTRRKFLRFAIILGAAIALFSFFSRAPSATSPPSITKTTIHDDDDAFSSKSGTPSSHLLLDVSAPSAVHGWVHKKGPAAIRTWHSSEDEPRRIEWDTFLQKRAAGATPMTQQFTGVPPHGPDPWGCRIYFNHAYKLMFIRTAKTGSTTIVDHIFPPCLYNPNVPHCMERLADTDMTAKQVAALWKKYTVFTFTRNVWSRAVSQYQYLVHFVKSDASCRWVKWDEFCADPLAVGAVCRENAECCTKKWTHQDWHMRQQTSCFLTDKGEWAVDYIGRLEHFDEDLIELFAYVNKKKSSKVPLLVHSPPPLSNSNPLDCRDEVVVVVDRAGDDDDYRMDGDDDDDDGEVQLVLAAQRQLKDESGGGSSFGGSFSAEERRENRHGGGGHRRRLHGAFDAIDGNQLPDVTYCDKSKFFRGRHAPCFAAMNEFFARDVDLLHANLTV